MRTLAEINEKSKDYENLYSSEVNVGPTDHSSSSILKEINFIKVEVGQSSLLGAGVTLGEISEAIKFMKCGKAAGPDGLPIDIKYMHSSECIRQRSPEFL